jgi:signal transduction histidine kinase
MNKTIIAIVGFVMLAGWLSVQAEDLTTIHAVKQLSRVEAGKGLPVRLTGIVAHQFDWAEAPFTLADLSDPTGSALFIRTAPQLSRDLKVGDVLEIVGTTSAGRLVPGVQATQITHLRTATIPVPEVKRIADLQAISQNNPLVSLVGIPQTIKLTSSGLTLSEAVQMSIMTPDGPFTAEIQMKHPKDWNAETLIDAEIIIRGCLSPFYNQRAEFFGIRLHVSGTNDLVVLKPAPADPFHLPITPLNEILPIGDARNNGHRRRVNGTVTFSRQNTLYVQDVTHAIRINTRTAVHLPIGTVVDGVGFPALGNCFAELNEALLRQTATSPLPEPLRLSPEIIAASRQPNPGKTARDIDGLLVRMQGRIVQIGEPVNKLRSILFRSQGTVYTAYLQEQKEVASFIRNLPQNQPVEMTGILTFHRTGDQHERFPQDWNLLLRDTSDIQILAGGPWLTRQREIALQIITVLLLLLTIVIIVRLRLRLNTQKQHQHDMDLLLAERKRIAADLHDTLQQNLAGISLQVKTALKATETAPGKVASFLQMTRQALEDAHAMLRISVWDLRGADTCGKSLAQAILDLAPGLPEHTLTCRLDALPKDIPEACSTQLLAVIKESITNIVKHAAATEIVITASQTQEGFQITIDDNGKGFEATALSFPATGHYGLTGMKERMRRIDGLFQIESEPGHGTRVILTFPISKNRRLHD